LSNSRRKASSICGNVWTLEIGLSSVPRTSTPTAPFVASVNVLGSADGGSPVSRLPAALAVEGAHVHLYGKSPAPGRKLGHVTVCGTDPADVRDRAWRCAVALGTPVPAGLLVAP